MRLLTLGTAFGTDLSEPQRIEQHVERLNKQVRLLLGPTSQTSKTGEAVQPVAGARTYSVPIQ